MGAHHSPFCISWCFQHHNHLNPWCSAALLNFAIFSSLLVCTHHLSLPLAAEAGGTAANEWSKDITNTSHQETLQRNLPVPFQWSAGDLPANSWVSEKFRYYMGYFISSTALGLSNRDNCDPILSLRHREGILAWHVHLPPAVTLPLSTADSSWVAQLSPAENSWPTGVKQIPGQICQQGDYASSNVCRVAISYIGWWVDPGDMSSSQVIFKSSLPKEQHRFSQLKLLRKPTRKLDKQGGV